MNKPNTSSKKMTKVAVASALGLALLAGGSTFALWSNTAEMNTSGTVTTGDLNVTASAVQNWVDVTDPKTPTPIDSISDYRLVPGSTIKLTQEIKTVLVGDNILGSLKVKIPNMTTGAALTQGVYTVAIKNATGDVIASGTSGGVDSDGNLQATAVDLSETGPEGSSLTVEVTVGLPSDADNATKLQTISLGNMQITLDQAS